MNWIIKPSRRVLILTAIWLLCSFLLYIDYDRNYLTKDLWHTGSIVLASLLTFGSFCIDYARYKGASSRAAFRSVIVAVFGILVFLVVQEGLKRQDDTPVVLEAVKWPVRFFGNSTTIEFRENGTYKCVRDKGFLGSSYTYRGKYAMKDSTVMLDRSDLVDGVPTNSFLIKQLHDGKTDPKNLLGMFFHQRSRDTLAQTYMLPVNRNGDTIALAARFFVTGGSVDDLVKK